MTRKTRKPLSPVRREYLAGREQRIAYETILASEHLIIERLLSDARKRGALPLDIDKVRRLRIDTDQQLAELDKHSEQYRAWLINGLEKEMGG